MRVGTSGWNYDDWRCSWGARGQKRYCDTPIASGRTGRANGSGRTSFRMWERNDHSAILPVWYAHRTRRSSCRPGRDGQVVLRRIGYWRNADDPELPDPASFVTAWDPDVKEDVVDYLRRGFVSLAAMGWSGCRLCGCRNGCLELTDGTWCWPDGLAHYVEAHDVALPQEVVEHILRRSEELFDEPVDDSWWVQTMTAKGEDNAGRGPASRARWSQPLAIGPSPRSTSGRCRGTNFE